MIKGIKCLVMLLTLCTMHAQEQGMKFEDIYRNKKVLITGGCGFIGSHLVERLVACNARVTVLDNLSTGKMENIAAVRECITFIEGDVGNYIICQEAVEGQDIVFHLAAFISVPESVEKPLDCHHSNVDGTVNLLECARKNGIERFVFSSSAAVYGPYEGICCENSTPCKPSSPYGLSKLIGEEYCMHYAQIYHVPTVMLRYFNVYGPRQNPHGGYAAAVARFTHQMRNGLPITIFGDGMQTRDFIPVSQIVEANLRVGCAQNAAVAGKVFNIATGKSVTLLELIEQLKADFPTYQAAVEFAPERAGDVRHSQANVTRYRSIPA